MEIKSLIADIKKERGEINSLFFVGCGASMADLYPAKFFMEQNALKIRTGLFTSNEFVHSTPASVNEKSIVVACSLGGTTPETVEAAKKAMELGAKVISLTHDAASPLAKNSHCCLVFTWGESYSSKADKMTKALNLAVEVLHQFEGYAHYDAMVDAFGKIYGIIDEAVKSVRPSAHIFAENYKDAPVIYVMGSGASYRVAYSFSICLLMEMQWINSGSFHDGEFFHGPFEITDKDVPFVLLMNEGKTRALDSRALTFLKRFEAKTTLLDAKDFGLGSHIDSSVVDYFNPMLHSAVLRIYAEELAVLRDHPLTKRRYMWKLEY